MIVIADDITGAAEMAGILFTHGEKVRLVCGCATTTDETTVIATDTRSMSEAQAVAETLRIAKFPLGARPFPQLTGALPCVIFKKTDSALRGHVVAELSALMQTLGYQRAIYLPANPSKGRIIRNGIYYINGKPIHETDFSFDPEFPAKTSVLKERFPEAEAKGIIMPDAESKEDIQRVIAKYDDGQTLFAGAADLFEAVLDRGDGSADPVLGKTDRQNRPHDPLTSASTLFLCGSTQSKPLDLGIAITEMPLDIYDGSKDLKAWQEEASAIYQQTESLMITIPFHHRTGKEVAAHLREMTATLIEHLVAQREPQQLIIEGGASAFATLQRLGWNELEMVAQLAPGVIKTKAPNGTFVIMKPGSYPWIMGSVLPIQF